MVRHKVKPGITGLWQVESRDDPSFADYERCDVFYVENWSVRLDLMILLQTLLEVLKRATSLLRKSKASEELLTVTVPVLVTQDRPSLSAVSGSMPRSKTAASHPKMESDREPIAAGPARN